MNLALLTWRNLTKNRTRTLLTILAAGVAVLTFILLRTVLAAWNAAAEYSATDRLATRNKVSLMVPLPQRYINQVRETSGVQAASFATLVGLRDPRNPANAFTAVAAEPASFLNVYSEISLPGAQRETWLRDRQGVVLGDVLAKQLGVAINDHITLQGASFNGDIRFTVSGIYRPLRKSIDRSQFLCHWEYLNELLPTDAKDQISFIASKVVDEAAGTRAAAAIDHLFADRDIQTSTMSERALNLSFMATISAVLKAIEVISFGILLIMALVVGNTIAMGVRERTTDWGVLRAIGFHGSTIAKSILFEGLLVGALAGVIGVALGFPIVDMAMGRWLEENMGRFFPYFGVQPRTIAESMTLALALGALAAIIPAYNATSGKIVDSLRRVQ